MEEDYYRDRVRLRALLASQPDWSRAQLAEAGGRSLGWVKKWCRRLRGAAAQDEQVLWSQSRARHTTSSRVSAAVIERILDIRDHPPDHLQRRPGPRAILYYLHQDASLQASGDYLPRSTRTVWEVLVKHGRIVHRPQVVHEPLEPLAPHAEWQIDFKDVSTVPADPQGKQRHGVEVLDVVDAGTSLLVEALPRADYTAETALLALTDVLRVHGRPQAIRLDRDPRFVGSWTASDFPSAFMRFVLCLGIALRVCPPHRPDKNPYVERYHRTYEYECVRVQRPASLAAVCEVTQAFQVHYNTERPNQARSCANQPPARAHPDLPTLPRLPDWLDPDGWVQAVDGQLFKRRVQPNGRVQLGDQRYYLSRSLARCTVLLQVLAPERQLRVLYHGQVVKTLPLKGLYGARLPFQAYLTHICQEARSEWQRWRWSHRAAPQATI